MKGSISHPIHPIPACSFPSHFHVSLVEMCRPSCLRRGTRMSIIPSSFLHFLASVRNMPIGGVDWYLRTCSSMYVGG
jgi:hypothetical protein